MELCKSPSCCTTFTPALSSRGPKFSPPATRVIPARHVSHADTVKTGMSKARVRGPCVVTGRLTGAPYSVSVTALEAPEVRRPLRGPLGRKAAIAASRVVA
jgi:hypothetical protein